MQQHPPLAKIHPNVEIGENASVGEFVIVGEPPRGRKSGELRTVIGRDAVIRSHTVIYAGCVIGDDFQTGHHVLVREECVIGDRVSIGSSSVVEAKLHIADDVRIHTQAFIAEKTVLEKGCWIGPNVVVTNAPYPLCRNSKETFKGAIIRREAKVGANVTILPGVEVGAQALVGAGTVISRDIPEREVHVGNPNRKMKTVDQLPYDL